MELVHSMLPEDTYVARSVAIYEALGFEFAPHAVSATADQREASGRTRSSS